MYQPSIRRTTDRKIKPEKNDAKLPKSRTGLTGPSLISSHPRTSHRSSKANPEPSTTPRYKGPMGRRRRSRRRRENSLFHHLRIIYSISNINIRLVWHKRNSRVQVQDIGRWWRFQRMQMWIYSLHKSWFTSACHTDRDYTYRQFFLCRCRCRGRWLRRRRIWRWHFLDVSWSGPDLPCFQNAFPEG